MSSVMPSTCDASDLSRFLLRLYRLAHEQPIDAFQDAALDRLRELLPFDSCMWGTATSTSQGIDIHTIHLRNQPPEMVQAYENIKHLDTAARAVARPGRHTISGNLHEWYTGPEQAPFLDHGARFEQANFLVCSNVDLHTQWAQWISLFRADPAARSSEREARLLTLLAPHVMQALSLNQIDHLNRCAAAHPASGHGRAICDLRGAVHHADPAFVALLQAEWSGWRGQRLPDALLDGFLGGHTVHVGPALVVSHRHEHGLLFLWARAPLPVDRLTPRERLVAHLAAQGSTHKEIAQTLRRSPATVRNQLQSVYDKLEIGHVAQLVEALRAAAMP